MTIMLPSHLKQLHAPKTFQVLERKNSDIKVNNNQEDDIFGTHRMEQLHGRRNECTSEENPQCAMYNTKLNQQQKECALLDDEDSMSRDRDSVNGKRFIAFDGSQSVVLSDPNVSSSQQSFEQARPNQPLATTLVVPSSAIINATIQTRNTEGNQATISEYHNNCNIARPAAMSPSSLSSSLQDEETPPAITQIDLSDYNTNTNHQGNEENNLHCLPDRKKERRPTPHRNFSLSMFQTTTPTIRSNKKPNENSVLANDSETTGESTNESTDKVHNTFMRHCWSRISSSSSLALDNETLMKFGAYFVGLQIFYLSAGYLQEFIMTTDFEPTPRNPQGRFPSASFCVFCNRCVALLVALVMVRRRHGAFFAHNKAPVSVFIPCAISNTLSSICQYASLKYVSFPLMTVFKSSTIIPVMIMGYLLHGSTYPISRYIEAIVITTGVAIFSLNSSHNDNTVGTEEDTVGGDIVLDESLGVLPAISPELLGMVLLLGYVIMDSFTTQWQHKIYSIYGRDNVDPYQMMLGVDATAIFFASASLWYSGEFVLVFEFFQTNAHVLWYTVLCPIMSAGGQLFIFYTLQEFGPLVLTVIMTTRKLFSIAISSALFGHSIRPSAAVGGVLILVAILHGIRRRKNVSPNNSSSAAAATSFGTVTTGAPNKHSDGSTFTSTTVKSTTDKKDEKTFTTVANTSFRARTQALTEQPSEVSMTTAPATNTSQIVATSPSSLELGQQYYRNLRIGNTGAPFTGWNSVITKTSNNNTSTAATSTSMCCDSMQGKEQLLTRNKKCGKV